MVKQTIGVLLVVASITLLPSTVVAAAEYRYAGQMTGSTWMGVWGNITKPTFIVGYPESDHICAWIGSNYSTTERIQVGWCAGFLDTGKQTTSPKGYWESKRSNIRQVDWWTGFGSNQNLRTYCISDTTWVAEAYLNGAYVTVHTRTLGYSGATIQAQGEAMMDSGGQWEPLPETTFSQLKIRRSYYYDWTAAVDLTTTRQDAPYQYVGVTAWTSFKARKS